MVRSYCYVGPADILKLVNNTSAGFPIRESSNMTNWLKSQFSKNGKIVATFAVDFDGILLLADRHSEYVVCSGGKSVLAAGELVFQNNPDVRIISVTNQSTRYCPDLDCWESIHSTLSKLGMPFPDSFTPPFVFRRCDTCSQVNIVKDGDFFCSVCDSELARSWNF
ncbi:hypothetical protein [Deinococcus sp.]|uniref:hypothetical protein n=1 Tax=Deinococcus sp. TaxID=47478 RepID=UPI003C7A4D0D